MAGVPRFTSIEDMSSESVNRRSSGRARKPTAKFEALAGTKFNPTDQVAPRTTHSSESPVPSQAFVVSKSISPLSESLLQPDDTPTSPSNISFTPSIELNIDTLATSISPLSHSLLQPDDTPTFHSTTSFTPSIELNTDTLARSKEAIENASPADSIKRESRRTRKPTQRALEATESMPMTRRQHQTKGDRELSEMRISTTPSDSSTAPGQSIMSFSAEATQPGRRSRRPDIIGNTPGDRERQGSSEKKSEASSLPVAINHSEELESASSPSNSEPRPRLHMNKPSNVASKEQKPDNRPRLTRNRSSAAIIDSCEESLALSLEPEVSNSAKPRSNKFTYEESAPKAAEPAEDTPVGLAVQRARRSQRESEPATASEQTASALKPHQATEREGIKERPKRAVSKPASYATADDDEENANIDDARNPPVRRSPRSSSDSPNIKNETKQQVTLKLTNHAASPAPEEPEKKSLKLTLRAPGLKGPRLPSKLRYSILSQEEADFGSVLTDQPQQRPDKAKESTPRNRGKGKGRAKTPTIPIVTIGQPKPSVSSTQPFPRTSLPPQKLSRRAQAKVEAKAMGRVRQAAVPLTQNLHQAPVYVASASHYVPSAKLISPAMGCNLFCLDPPSRILAFAQIAVESNDSDEEETSENGQQPQLYEKWLEKGRDRFCVCDRPSHAHSHQAAAGTSPSDGHSQDAERSSADIEQILNHDIVAAIPRNAVLPIAVPPVNSIMRKSQGRRVSALYNVLAGSSASGGSVGDRTTSLSHSHSPASHSPGPNSNAPPGASPGFLNHAHQSLVDMETRSQQSVTPVDTRASIGGRSPAAMEQTRQPSPHVSSGMAFEERMRWDQQMLDRIRREAHDSGIAVKFDMSYNQIKAALEVKNGKHSCVSPRLSTTPSTTSSTGASWDPAEGVYKDNAGARKEELVPSRAASDASSVNTNKQIGHGSDWPLPFPDDEDDRLMQIIGDSVRMTKKRNAAQTSTSRPTISSRSQTSEGNRMATVNGADGRSTSSPAKRKGAPSYQSEGNPKRQRVSAGRQR